MKGFKKKDRNTDIDLSPLIDMVFILLIFFMVSTTFVKDAKVEIKRPSAASAAPASTKALRVNIDQAGALYLDGIPVKAWMLQSKVRDAFRGGADKNVLVIADRKVPIERLIEAIDQLRLAGAADVAVATEKEYGGS
ncbi:MAG: biopolymer transporter ExbD [Myxococcales bacterium]|nr:biopolymer transporter ExbD [Myxococcales bacterium]